MSVKVNGTLSNSFPQTSGVAQGTSLGPLCFLIYINDLSMHIKNCILKLFADDAKIYFCYPRGNWSDLLQIDLNNITQWALLWQLTISIEKTCMLYLGNGNSRNVYVLNNVNLTVVDSVKDLGVIVTSDLSWHIHISRVTITYI